MSAQHVSGCIASTDKDMLSLSIEYLEDLSFVCQMRVKKRDFKLESIAPDLRSLWQHDMALLERIRELLFQSPIVGLLTSVNQDEYRFSHLTLQEYLAARCAVRLYGHDAKELLAQVAAGAPLHDQWRREVLQFTACILEPEAAFTEFCQAILEAQDEAGINCELVRAVLEERGESEIVEQMLRDKLLQLRSTESLVAGLCHISFSVSGEFKNISNIVSSVLLWYIRCHNLY